MPEEGFTVGNGETPENKNGIYYFKAVSKCGVESEVQQKVIPSFLGRKDVIVQSQTGSGKTLSFLIPLFEIIQNERSTIEKNEVYGLIISPTRELAQQIYNIAKVFTK